MTVADRIDTFRGVAHPMRRKILRMIDERECTVGELQAATGAQATALSQHLTILRETGLVTFRIAGTRHYYRIKRAALKRIVSWANQFSK